MRFKRIRIKWIYFFFMWVIIATIYAIQPTAPKEYQIENFPYYKQPDKISCGPTSVKMLLEYYEVKKDLKEIRTKTKTDWTLLESFGKEKVGMTSPEYIKKTLDYYGVRSKIKVSTLAELKHSISQNKPPIVLIRTGDYLWHYVVAIGYTPDYIFIADPAYGKERKVPINRFERAWKFEADLSGDEGSKEMTYALSLLEIRPNIMIMPLKSLANN